MQVSECIVGKMQASFGCQHFSIRFCYAGYSTEQYSNLDVHVGLMSLFSIHIYANYRQTKTSSKSIFV